MHIEFDTDDLRSLLDRLFDMNCSCSLLHNLAAGEHRESCRVPMDIELAKKIVRASKAEYTIRVKVRPGPKRR